MHLFYAKKIVPNEHVVLISIWAWKLFMTSNYYLLLLRSYWLEWITIYFCLEVTDEKAEWITTINY